MKFGTRKRSYYGINEHFEEVFNAVRECETTFAYSSLDSGLMADLYYYPAISCFSCTLFMQPLDFIGNAPTGFSDQSDAIHPAGFPIIRRLAEKNIPNCAGFSFGFKVQ